MSQSLELNIAKVRQRIAIAAKKYCRELSPPQLIAVSKTRPATAIRAAAGLGLMDFGENYLQESLQKIAELQDLALCWHFIGPIQANKTRQVAEHFDWVHSVDRLKIAQRLSSQRPLELAPLQICLQVNLSNEDSKSGVSLQQLPQLAQQVAGLPQLQLRGLMAIPKAVDDCVKQRQQFGLLAATLTSLQQQLPALDTLSMGMSNDMEAAIAEGATMIRIGTDIFGPREQAKPTVNSPDPIWP